MTRPHWIIQANLHREEGHARLLDALDRIQASYTCVQVLPFTDTLVLDGTALTGQDVAAAPAASIPRDVPVFGMGSYKLARILHASGAQPGAFLDGLDYPTWAAGWGHSRLLNPNAWIGPLHAASVQQPSFVRPTADSKTFAGRVFNPAAFSAWQAEAAALGSAHVADDTEVLIAPVVRDLYYEVRTWVVDGDVVTASLYRRGGRVHYSPDVDHEALDFARACARAWSPSPAYVLDVARTEAGMLVVEANCLSASGFYAGDMLLLVQALDDLLRRGAWGPR